MKPVLYWTGRSGPTLAHTLSVDGFDVPLKTRSRSGPYKAMIAKKCTAARHEHKDNCSWIQVVCFPDPSAEGPSEYKGEVW